MKIRTDVNELAYNKPTRGLNQPEIKRTPGKNLSSIRIDPQLLDAITTRINSERSLSEALSIAQASQSLLQKAMVISSQLRNIASQAVVEGRVNSAEVDVALSDINAVFSNYNQGLTGPVRAFVDIQAEVPALPGIDEDIAAVRTIADSLQQGSVPELSQIDKTIGQISVKTDQYSSAIRDYTHILNAGAASENYTAVQTRVNSTVIAENPGMALIAQGNLKHEGVQKILFG